MAVTKDESREKIREKANREYQRVQSVKKLSGTYNPVEREKLQREYRDALVALDNEAIGHRKNAALAQKEYDDYVNSQEFQQRKREAAVKLTQNVPASEVPRNAPQMMEIFEDETSQGLKAKADYYKKLSNDEKNRRVMAQDMAEINAMPEEDRKLFEQYAESQNAQRDVFAYTNPIRWFGYQNEVDDAWKPLVEKYGEEHLAELKESYNWYASQQMAEQIAQDVHANNDAAGSAVAQQVIGFPARALGGVDAMAGRIFEMGDRTGRYTTLSPYTPNDALSVFGNDVTADTAERIAGDGDSKVRKGLSAGYQMVTSAADSAARLFFGGGASGSLALAGINSFTDTLREASQKGAPPAQAYLMATANAGLEVLTEKVSLDKALDKAKQLGGSDLRKWVLNTLGQAGVEASEEEASYFGGLLAEAAILQGNSEYNQTIGELVASGMNYEEAKAQANKNVWNEALNTLIISAGSGAIMGAGTTAYSDVMTKLGKQGTKASPQEAAESLQAGILPETSMDTTKAQSPDVEAAGAPQTGNALTNALDKLAETGNVSNKTVEKILADPAAMEQLSRQAGLDLSQMATASEKRNAVKAAVRQLAGDTAPTTLNREGAQSLIEDMGQELAERAPARQETPEVTPERQAVQNAFDRVLGVDTGNNGNYNQINENPIQGGIENAGTAEQGTAQGAGNQLYGAPGEGVQQVQGSESGNPGLQGGRDLGQGDIRDSGELLLSETAQKALSEKGSPDVRMYQDSDAQTFVDALNEGRNSDVKNGWCVSPKEVSDLTQPGVKSYLAENGQAGFVINNGDIEAVFTNKAKGAPRGLADSLMLRALSAGGNKLDCYGETLAKIYSKYGFEPVARVEFNKTYANEGWTPDKGEPYIYVMKHNGDSADTVAQKMGDYPRYSKEQLEALPTYGKNDYDAALAYRDSLMGKGSPQVADTSGQSTKGGQAVGTVGMQNEPSGDLEVSRTVSNTGLHSKDADIRQGYKQMVKENPDAGIYDVKHNADTTATAKERTSTPEKVQAEYDYLMGKDAWTAEDLLTAKYVTKNLVHSEIDGAQNQITEMNMKIREIGTNAGQVTQAFAISGTMADLQDSMTAAQRARNAIFDMKREDSTFRQKEGGETYKQWQKDIAKNIDRIAIAVELVDDGDSAGMRDIIRQIARERNTTAWFGTSQNLTGTAERILGKMDFDDLKTVANAQIAAMSDDFRARTKTEIAMGIRKQNMLASLKTFARNITGNSFGGLMDSASDSTGGRMMDAVLSKFTGRKTVGNDFKNVKAYAKGAADAASFASLCVELNIPIETGAGASLSTAMGDGGSGKYMGRTFRSTGNVAMRAMYAFQKYMSYSLEVTDKIFEGGTNAAISESLNNLKNANLTEEQIAQLSEFTANRRTFKDATWKDSGGKTRGSDLSRAAAGFKRGAGDIFGKPGEVAVDAVIPFASVPMNVTQTGIDYSTGVVKSVGEAISLIKDAKAGKEIDVARQRQVASDFGRGLSGVGMIAMFTAAAATGVVKVNEPKDKDEKALLQAEGRSGAQINWSALKRGLDGGSSEWQDGDIITSLDFLEPFNTQLYLGYELSKEDSVADMLKAYPFATVKSVFNSLMDSPMMTGLSGGVDLISGVVEADDASGIMDELAGYAGDTAGSFIPQFVRQTAQLTDGYYRDTRGETSAEYAINNIIAGLPFLSQTLPKKYSGLGEAQERGGFFNTFVDPTKTQTYRKNDVTNYLEELSGSLDGDTSFIPDRQAPMSIHVNGETVNLDGEARETYQKTYGELVSSYYTGLMGSEAFRNLSDEQKANALNRAKTYATEHARAAVSDYTTDSPKDAKTVENSIMQDLVRSEFSKAFDTMEPEALGQAYSIYESLGNAQKQEFKNGTGGRIGYYITARENGVSGETFASLYGVYKNLDDNSGMAGKDKAQEWARTLGNAYESGQITKAAHDALKDKMVFRQTFSIETEKFDAMTESGLSSDVADRIIKGLADLQGTGSVDKDTGEATVTNRDKWGYIAALDGLSDKEKDRIMLLYMPDYNPEAEKPNKTELKYAYLRGRGYSAEQFTQTYGVTQEFTKKADMIAAWVALGYSSEEAQMFYKLYKGKLV
ncbi:hypothetical protein [Neglectibacter timonensis]|uniref:hypothetical protein n=1 Tax=Neglectibacter timonensis TaxID=1776382 RepID=UPI00248F117C|nr:hypothetical protein [Neglectibacter timonensis]